MPSNFRIVDVPAERIIEVALAAATRDHSSASPLQADDAMRVLNVGRQQASNALIMAEQLALVKAADGGYRYSGEPSLRNAHNESLPQFFRAALQAYGPFLLFLNYLRRGFLVEQAARHCCVAFTVGLAPERVATLFSRWGSYSSIIRPDGTLDYEPVDLLEIGFLSRLTAALRSQLGTKLFVFSELGDVVLEDLFSKGIAIQEIAEALIKHAEYSKDALGQAANVLENYLSRLQEDSVGPHANLQPLAESLFSKGAILRSHRNISVGVAGFRNPSNHGPDPDTGLEWEMTDHAALLGVLTTLYLIRSIAVFQRGRAQVL